jgi:hypothetical protein
MEYATKRTRARPETACVTLTGFEPSGLANLLEATR